MGLPPRTPPPDPCPHLSEWQWFDAVKGTKKASSYTKLIVKLLIVLSTTVDGQELTFNL